MAMNNQSLALAKLVKHMSIEGRERSNQATSPSWLAQSPEVPARPSETIW